MSESTVRQTIRHRELTEALVRWDAAAPRIKVWHVSVEIGALMDPEDVPLAHELGRQMSEAIKAEHPNCDAGRSKEISAPDAEALRRAWALTARQLERALLVLGGSPGIRAGHIFDRAMLAAIILKATNLADELEVRPGSIVNKGQR